MNFAQLKLKYRFNWDLSYIYTVHITYTDCLALSLHVVDLFNETKCFCIDKFVHCLAIVVRKNASDLKKSNKFTKVFEKEVTKCTSDNTNCTFYMQRFYYPYTGYPKISIPVQCAYFFTQIRRSPKNRACARINKHTFSRYYNIISKTTTAAAVLCTPFLSIKIWIQFALWFFRTLHKILLMVTW